jgi:DNA-binding NtrC family response regulator
MNEHEPQNARLERLIQNCLGLTRTVSLEAAASQLTHDVVEQLGVTGAAVYAIRGPRLVRQGQTPAEAGFGHFGVAVEDLETLEGSPEAYSSMPWVGLGPFEEISIVPLRGRQQTVGFLAWGGGPSCEHLGVERLVELGGHVGVLLENFLHEERRSKAMRLRLRKRTPSLPQLDPLPAVSLGESAGMKEVAALVSRLARVDSRVLLQGETGTGKSLIARMLHDQGPRGPRPFLTLNCAAIPDGLVESELFGHMEGAFTGATRTHRGKIEQAEGGTLFLDEIGELPLSTQSKLLTFLEVGRYSPVGAELEQQADVRILSATNSDLDAAVEAKRFRSDLLYRLNVFVIELPPLRERGADILTIARGLAKEVADHYGFPAPTISPDGEASLLSYEWRGNVRELRNVVERAVVLAEGGDLSEYLPAPARVSEGNRGDLSEANLGWEFDEGVAFAEAKKRVLEQWERAYISKLLLTTGGNLSAASRLVGIDRKNLQRKIKKYSLDLDSLRGA